MRRRLLSLAVCGFAVAFSLALPMRTDGEVAAVMSVSPSVKTTDYVDGPFQVEVMASNVSGLGAYGFRIKFNPSILKFTAVTPGPLLGSTGRFQACPPPIDLGGQVQYGCYTNGSFPAGANGDGKLATLTFEPIAHGSTSLDFVNPQISDIFAGPDVTSAVGGSVTVNGGPDPKPFVPPSAGSPSSNGGSNPVIGGADPTGDPLLDSSGYLTTGPNGEPGSGVEPGEASSGVPSSGVQGAGAGQPVQGPGGAQPSRGGDAGGFGLFGFGPGSSDGPWPFVAALLALSGGGLLLAGIAKRLRT